jgi:outer membrane lipoprotein-sorting protein/thiol-disulfide isomerase/thioredoxin
MKNLIRLLVVLTFLVASASVQAQSVHPKGLEERWLNGAPGYEHALQLQRELNLPLVVYFYTDWCPFCRSLNSQYLTAATVQNYLSGVIKVRINPEHGRPEKQLAEQFGVAGFPYLFVIRNPSSLPMRVHPFRRGAPNLTPAQFAKALREPALWSIGPLQMSPVSVGITPIPPKVGPQVQMVSATVPASTSKAALPAALNSILERYVTALGGREAVANLKSRVTRARIDIAGVSFGGRLETFAKAPNMLVTVMKTESTGTVKRGFDGRTSWMISNQKEFKNPSPMDLAALAADADFYREIKLKDHYSRVALVGTGTVGTRAAHIVEATPRIGAVEKLYFDVETGLLLRRDAMSASSRGVARSELYFSDWREVDGVKIPFKTTELTAGATYIYTLEEVKHNVPLDEGIFRQP